MSKMRQDFDKKLGPRKSATLAGPVNELGQDFARKLSRSDFLTFLKRMGKLDQYSAGNPVRATWRLLLGTWVSWAETLQKDSVRANRRLLQCA